MAVNLKFLSKSTLSDTNRSYTYADLYLDFKLNAKTSNTPTTPVLNQYDVKVIYDETAIKQSIRNIFNTKPGEKILNPAFGLDLSKYLFEGVTEDTASDIFETISNDLPRWEPRIKIEKIRIKGNVEQQEFVIDLIIRIPRLNSNTITIQGVLDTEGFRYE